MERTIVLPQGTWRYEDTMPLGPRGGFGVVYPARNAAGEIAAIKVFHDPDPDAAKRELAFAESRIGRLDDHVIPILGCGIDATNGRACIVMARADANLAQRLAVEGAFEEAAAVAIALQVVRGLLSAKEWVHRDLKPANVLLMNGRWCIADFGIARLSAATTSMATLRECRTPPYAAPEQWNEERADHATDVYALGCILHELLTGRPVFPGPATADYAAQHRTSPPDIGSIPCTPRLRILLAQMLAKAQTSRPELTDLEQRFDGWSTAQPGPLAVLSAAAAAVAEQDAIAEASKARDERRKDARRAAQADARARMELLRGRLFDSIAAAAPNARVDRRGLPLTMWSAQLGEGTLWISLGQYPAVDESAFPVSGWDVVAGESLFVRQNNYQRSASLWFMRTRNDEPYQWYEVAYYGGGVNDAKQPCDLPPDRDADMAASLVGHTWNVAHPPRPLEESGRLDAFVSRWSGYLAAGAQGRLVQPSLPEPE